MRVVCAEHQFIKVFSVTKMYNLYKRHSHGLEGNAHWNSGGKAKKIIIIFNIKMCAVATLFKCLLIQRKNS